MCSIVQQTIQPERVMVYIAEGYERPNFTIGKEEYVWVKKGMMAQRLLSYDDITSDCILMLDDDVSLSPDSAERMLRAMEENEADCVGADTFCNHKMSTRMKFFVAITNLVFPYCGNKWAFKIHSNGSFSYNNNPTKSFYWSQSCAGPASLWRKSVYEELHLADELWLDDVCVCGGGIAYGDDMLEFYKLHKNGYRLGVLYDSGIEHLDGKTAGGGFGNRPQWMYLRTKAMFSIWWRTCFRPDGTGALKDFVPLLCFGFKVFWIFLVVCVATVIKRSPQLLPQYVMGIRDGWLYVHSGEYRKIGSYIIRSAS